MLKKAGRVRFIILWHLIWLNQFLLAIFLSLLDNLVEASVLRHEFALVVELKVDIDAIVLLNQFVEVQSIDQSLVF